MDKHLLRVFQQQVAFQCSCVLHAYADAADAIRAMAECDRAMAAVHQEIDSAPSMDRRMELIAASLSDNSNRTTWFAARDRFWYAIQGFLSSSANLSKLLWGDSSKLAVDREALRRSLQVEDTSRLRSKRMRNHFDHFDARIDQWWRESACRNYLDYTVSSVPVAEGMDMIDMFRHFNPQTGDLVLWGETYSVPEIAKEARRILPLAEAAAGMTREEWPDL